MEIVDELIRFMKDSGFIDKNVDVEVDSNLTDVYGIGSLDIVDIIVFCEEKFNIEFDFMDLDLDNFSSVSKIECTINNILRDK